MDVDSRYDGNRGEVDSYRRRSPGPYDRRERGRGSRNRSRSPRDIDRYQPGRLERDEEYRPRHELHRRRSSPPPAQNIDRYVPGQDANPPPIPINPLPNPLTLDYQVGFNWFAEWWRMDVRIKDEKERQKNGGRRLKGEREEREERGRERERIQEAYDQYKEKLQVQMARAFVQQHKSEEWFTERYDPETRQGFRMRLSGSRRGAFEKWVADLEQGTFDEFTLEGAYKTESNGIGGIAEKEEGETTAANEVLGVGDLLPLQGGELRDEAANQPTLLIKTIAPTVSRDKMEAFCKEHLGEGEGGFKWLSLSDPNPSKKCHRIGWVTLNPSEDVEMPEDDRGDGRDEDAEEGEEDADRPAEPVKRSTAVRALDEINGKTIHDEERGDFTCHVGIHEPPSVPRKKALWDLFSAPERVGRDLELATRVAKKLDEELGEGLDGVTKIQERVADMRSKGWLQPPAQPSTAAKSKKEKDLDVFDEEGEEDGAIEEEDEGAYEEETDDEELTAQKKELDLIVEYLRRVFNFCFFCVFESDSVHELMRKCPGGHLRRPRSSLTSAAKEAAKNSAEGLPFPARKDEPSQAENGAAGEPGASPIQEKKFPGQKGKSQQQLQRAFNWVKTYEEKILQYLEPENADIRKLGGKPFDEALEDEVIKYVKQEDDSKFRCKVPECTKLFKGQSFWRKHIEKRHEDFFAKVKKDVEMTTAYVLDPAHIAPSRNDSNSNGHFPINNAHGHPTGTPRGFNLASMPFAAGFVPQPPMGGMPGQFPGIVGGQPLPGSWVNPNGMIGPEGDIHSIGPNRRGGGRSFGQRSTGPYDRNGGRDQRNMRWNAGGPMGMPGVPMVGGMPGVPMMGVGRGGPIGGMRFADGMGGAAGPREAVQGRSLKSYEDLDAAGGSGTGELNY